MTTEGARHVDYADLVAGLLDARLDPASERFDEELEVAVAEGMVTPDAARTLRFWQRASVRGLVEHARNVLPPALSALDAARGESQETGDAEQRSLAEATGAPPVSATGIASTSPELPSINLAEHRRGRLIVAGLVPDAARDDSHN